MFSAIVTARPTFAGLHPGFATLPGIQAAFAEFAPTLAGTHSGFAAFADILPAFAEFALPLTDSLLDSLACLASLYSPV